MFDQLSDKILRVVRDLKGKGKITEENIDHALRQVRLNLLEADVHYQVVKDFIDRVRQSAVGEEVLESLTPGQAVVKIIYDQLCDLLGSQAQHLNLTTKPPVAILMVGLQGSGKTTTTAKLAQHLKSKGRKPYLVPADVTRPAAIDQLQQLAKRLNVPVYPTRPKDNPIKICAKAMKEAVACNADTLLVDTAGRLHIDEALMKELKKIAKTLNPQEILLVADAMTGQDAVNIAKHFNQELDLSGVVLTKMDGNARAGAAFSIKAVTGKPIKFMGTGEGVDALEVFHPDRIASRILDMGDIVSFAEKAQEVFDEEQAHDLMDKMRKNEFSLDDFRKQLRQMKKLGSMESLIGMLPGAKKLKDKVDFKDAEVELKKKEAIIDSMTLLERKRHHILNASRRKRIARGSGTRVQDVNRFMKEFTQMQKMMNKFGKMGLKGMSGLMNPFGK
jgi:signal recognition particle subunit SRP54